jgi:hypothetical protein
MRISTRLVGLSVAVILLVAASFSGSAGAEAVAQSATGGGRQLTGAGFGFRTFAFAAVKYNDGSVSGQAEVRNPVVGSLRHVQLDCLNVFPGNNGSPIAVASGVLTSAEDPALVGRRGIFAVQDNGEGADPLDRMTLGVNLNPATCTGFTNEDSLRSVFPRGLFDIDAGDIQVQP